MMTVFNHETVFDTANRTMTFIIHPRLQVVVNFRGYELLIVKDGNVIDRESYKGVNFTLDDMELILKQAHESCEKLRNV